MTSRLPGWMIRMLIWMRIVGFYFLEPVDVLARWVTGKIDLPPLAMRTAAGPLRHLESSGAEFAAYLKLLCRITPHGRVLDIGCGFGLMALYLKDYLRPPGTYVGLDVNRSFIRWGQGHLSKKHPNLRFVHVDAMNAAYNPRGKLSAANVRLPFDDGSFDCILLKSVFTHMRPQDVRNYVREVSRLLSPGGVCLATFFLLDASKQTSGVRRTSNLRFEFGDELWRFSWRGLPELAVAYREDHVIRMLEDVGLRVKAVHYGTWCGREDGLSYQDLVLVTTTD